MPLYLGFDARTESLSAIVIEIDGELRQVVFEHVLSFDRDLPAHGTTAGLVHHQPSPEAMAPPLLWADALDRMMSILARDARLDLGGIRAISGAGHARATVCVNRFARETWRTLAHDRPLAPQLAGTLSRELTPVVMDETLDAASIASHIHAFHAGNPGAYDATARIHLPGSFLASLLIGAETPLDPAAASGTSLMDLDTCRWRHDALDATAPGLALKLPEIGSSCAVAGTLSRYWQDRYCFPAAQVVTWSGDQPSHLVGTGAVGEGHLAVALGTIDTVLSHTRVPHPRASRVLRSPMGGFTNVVSFRNGMLTRDWILRLHHRDWDGVAATLERTPAGNSGAVMLPWLEAEVTPPVRVPGLRRFAYDGRNGDQDVRAVVEAQMMAMANHAPANADLTRIVATGGAALHDGLLQVMADVFDVPVERLNLDRPAALGAALRALHGDRLAAGEPLAWHTVVKGFTDSRPVDRVAPRAEAAGRYRQLRARYAGLEALHQDRPPIG